MVSVLCSTVVRRGSVELNLPELMIKKLKINYSLLTYHENRMTPCSNYRSVPQLRPPPLPPPFATLALVQNAGGADTQDVPISLAIMPSLPVSMWGWGPSAECEAERC